MHNKYPLWKNITIVLVTILGFIYALPNLYGDAPTVQISPRATTPAIESSFQSKVDSVLQQNSIGRKAIYIKDGSLWLRFSSTDNQLKAKDLIKKDFSKNYIVASSLTPSTPRWLSNINANPMKYGLDLRGGVHFLLNVDVDGVVERLENGSIKGISQDLRRERIRYSGMRRLKEGGIWIRFRNLESRDAAMRIIKKDYPRLLLKAGSKNGDFTILAKFSPASLNETRQYTIDQTMTVLRNRVNELGVQEPIVQQQGANRIAVDLPGVQDGARAQRILGGTATLEFHMEEMGHDARTAAQTGIVPIGTKLFDYSGRPVLLKNQVILTGQSITSAQATYGPDGRPAVNISLGGGGESLFSQTTRLNVGKRMGIVFVETKTTTRVINGKPKTTSKRVERVIMVATINQALGSNFQITGLGGAKEASNLALQLRAGALPANIWPVESRVLGPSLGKENIERGVISLEVGLALIMLVMLAYYRFFGLVANIALVINLVLLIAVLSLIGAVLTLPGIAGIVLTVGMAVDANVLIYERIREELRNKVTCQAAIFSGYERAFATIVDANVTTLIVAVVLFAIGSGPVKGFAVTLMIGLITSMITGIAFTRALVNWFYGRRKHLDKLSIGI